jgi:hypothetical protein
MPHGRATVGVKRVAAAASSAAVGIFSGQWWRSATVARGRDTGDAVGHSSQGVGDADAADRSQRQAARVGEAGCGRP